ncbi:kinase-like domain-containing protein [Cokeromyces recurvatus]|uniref:kinase-like domain-containing protein n=1 Tax=Cokeromyces recurvatus TaxID=90255 RepID=UPI00222112EF|nr:kinase-like domain-containing protein [Cokeromyces recurvatus]KAI7901787.1 kinase-like domain-containing protein [Cokeromyces recurvatus]
MSHSKTIGFYEIKEKLGKGSFAVVYKAKHKIVAIKAISQKKVNKNQLRYIEMEINIMRSIQHPYIIGYDDYIRTDSHAYLIMEYCSMGDMHDLIKETYQCRGMSEDVILHFLKQFASALKYLHDHDLIHRDIKPKNILLVSPLNHTILPDIKLADFGFAKILPKTCLANSVCGSPLYMAPEILNRQHYDAKVDLWSLGVVIYELMFGHTLFPASTHVELYDMVQRYDDQINFVETMHVFSIELKDLVKVLLKKNPVERASCEAFCHYVHLILKKDELREAATEEMLAIKENDPINVEDEYVVIESGLSPPSLSQPPSSSSSSLPLSGAPFTMHRSHSMDQPRGDHHSIKVNRSNSSTSSSNGSILTRAISMASLKLFGGTSHDKSSSSLPSSSSSTIFEERMNTPPLQTEEDEMMMMKPPFEVMNIFAGNELKKLMDVSKVVMNFADEKYKEHKQHPLDKVFTEEAYLVTLKTIFLLKRILEFIELQQQQRSLKEAAFLDWINRKLYLYTNRSSILSYSVETNFCIIEKILYDKAIDMSRAAAVNQLIGEDLYHCKIKYQESILLLEAILIVPDETTISVEDRFIIQDLIESLQKRYEKVVQQT